MKKCCVRCLQTISERSRLKIFEFIKKTYPVTVTDVANYMKLKQPTVTFHINKLAQAHLIRKKKNGREVFLKVKQISKNCNSCPLFR